MTLALPRFGLGSLATAAVLSLALATGAAAQVATLDETGSEPGESPVAASETLEAEEALLAFAQCMRDNGIDMDDPQFGLDGGRFGFGAGDAGAPAFDPGSPEFQGAMESCDTWLAALAPDTDAAAVAERAEQQLQIAACMRSFGYDFPDPTTGGGFGAQIRFLEDAGIDPQDPTFRTDISECQSAAGFDFGPPSGGGVAP